MDHARAHQVSHLTASGALLIVFLCALWGFNFTAIKIGNETVPPLLSATIRSAGATLLIGGWILARRTRMQWSRRVMWHGVMTGFLFSLEFIFLYAGTGFTSASRAVLLVYTAPLWVALGAHLFLRGDRLYPAKIAGLALSFLGVLAVFGAPAIGLDASHVLGDLLELLAAISWAGTTLYVKRYLEPYRIDPSQTLLFQLAFSIPFLFVATLVAGQTEVSTWEWDFVLSLLYQTVVVATFSYLMWFWLLRRTQASILHSFTFFAPLFGVLFGAWVLGDALPALLWLGLALVAAGTYLVNRPRRLPSIRG